MKIWILAHIITLMSFILAIGGAMLIDPFAIIGLAATAMIFQGAERIRRREAWQEEIMEREKELEELRKRKNAIQ